MTDEEINEIEALPPEPVGVYEECGFRWKATGRVGEYFHCVRRIDHPKDGPGGGGHTALPEWAGR